MTALSRTAFWRIGCLLMLGSAVIAAPPEKPAAPIIAKVMRSPRTDGVWHDIAVTYQGKDNCKLTLNVFWDAKTPAEDGKGTVSSKSCPVSTDAQGHGDWKLEVKGYPAGDMRANVHDENGVTGEMSPVFDMPWLY